MFLFKSYIYMKKYLIFLIFFIITNNVYSLSFPDGFPFNNLINYLGKPIPENAQRSSLSSYYIIWGRGDEDGDRFEDWVLYIRFEIVENIVTTVYYEWAVSNNEIRNKISEYVYNNIEKLPFTRIQGNSYLTPPAGMPYEGIDLGDACFLFVDWTHSQGVWYNIILGVMPVKYMK